MKFNLSEKRKNIHRLKPVSDYSSMYQVGWNKAIEKCNKQDKEFIKLLKKGFPENPYTNKWDRKDIIRKIDKLAGEKLI